MENYLKLLQEVVETGEWKAAAREGMPRTKELFHRTLRFNLQEGFPLLTTKKMYLKGILAELIWFLRGDTNIKFLLENNVHIWDSDCYKHQVRKGYKGTKEQMVQEILDGNLALGECGDIYGKQWRRFGPHQIDQIKDLIFNINSNPLSRYHLVTAWDPSVLMENNAALPACHVLFQCNIRKGRYLDLSIVQRSCDTFLGVPFNIASYAALIHILAYLTGYLPGELIWTGNSVHIYENHLEAIETQLTRMPYGLPRMVLAATSRIIEEIQIEDFVLTDYYHHSAIAAPLSVGV